MMYKNKYSKDDLYDMFAHQANPLDLANQQMSEIRQQLKELAPDMEDDRDVAHILKGMAHDKAYPNG